MESNILAWLSGLLAIINACILAYAAWKKLKPEIKKMDSETDLDVLEGAAKSQQMLIDRINDLQMQLTAERDVRQSELQQERNARLADLKAEKEARLAELKAEKEARRKESDYLRRRIKEAEREARDYRLWAAKLVKQVVESGKIPAAFIPSLAEDTDTGIPHINEDTGKDSNDKESSSSG